MTPRQVAKALRKHRKDEEWDLSSGELLVQVPLLDGSALHYRVVRVEEGGSSPLFPYLVAVPAD